MLEIESAELAARLVKGQVSRAEEEETSYVIQTEMLLLKRDHSELSHQLEMANEEIRALTLRLQENVSLLYLVKLHFRYITLFFQLCKQ